MAKKRGEKFFDQPQPFREAARKGLAVNLRLQRDALTGILKDDRFKDLLTHDENMALRSARMKLHRVASSCGKGYR